MGYNIYGSGSVTISAENIEAAAKSFVVAIGDEESITYEVGSGARALSGALEDRLTCFVASVEDGAVVISPTSDGFRRLSEDEWAFNALAPFIDEGDAFHFTGEDDYQWKWRFSKKGMTEIHGETVFGADTKAPKIVEEIVELLYPGGKSPKKWRNAHDKLDTIAELLRKSGFGPFAGLEALDALAKAAE